MKVLYISYDGLLEPLGYSQVWKYLEILSIKHTIYLLTFEKKRDLSSNKLAYIEDECRKAGITWKHLKYHKYPTAFATAYDIMMGIIFGIITTYKYRIEAVHARSYVPALIAIFLKAFSKTKYIFDMRGFWADEKVDGKAWPRNGCLYLITKWLERHLLLSADTVVSLTHSAVKEMKNFKYLKNKRTKFYVITTCTDMEAFKPIKHRSHRRRSSPLVLGYVGSVSLWYLFDEVIRCLVLLEDVFPKTHLHILNKGEHRDILERLDKHSIDKNSFTLEEADHSGVAKAMQKMDAGIFFIRPTYSKIASAPTKLGEFLASGVPCLVNSGIGDMAQILQKNNVGIVMPDFSEKSLKAGANSIIKLTEDPGIIERCRRTAEENFSLMGGAKSYNKIYENLSDG